MGRFVMLMLLLLAGAALLAAEEPPAGEGVTAGGALVVTDDDLPQVLFHAIYRGSDSYGEAVFLLLCETPDCAQHRVETIGVSRGAKLALTTDDRRVVSGAGGLPLRLSLLLCDSAECAAPFFMVCGYLVGCVASSSPLLNSRDDEDNPFAAVGWGHALTLMPGDLPLITYYGFDVGFDVDDEEIPTGAVYLAYCTDIFCEEMFSGAIDIFPVWAVYPPEQTGSLLMGPDGRFYLVYRDSDNETIRFLACEPSTFCAGTASVDLYPGGTFASLALRPDGRPVIALIDRRSLKLVLCRAANCETGVDVVDAVEGMLPGAALPLLLVDGLPAVFYPYGEPPHVRMTRCLDSDCTQLQTVVVDAEPETGFDLTAALDGRGLPLLFYYNPLADTFRLLRCLDLSCETQQMTDISDIWR